MVATHLGSRPLDLQQSQFVSKAQGSARGQHPLRNPQSKAGRQLSARFPEFSTYLGRLI